MRFIAKITLFSLLLGSACVQASNKENPEREFQFNKDTYPLLVELANNPVTYAQSSKLNESHPMTLEYYKSVVKSLGNKANWLFANKEYYYAAERTRRNIAVLKELEKLKNDNTYEFTEDETKTIDNIITNLKTSIVRYEATLMLKELEESEEKAKTTKE